MPKNLKTWIAGGILLGLLATSGAQALSIGDTSLRSYLMQPLDAVIRLHGTEGLNAADVKARVGDADDFEKLGIDYDSFTARLDLAVEESDGEWIVRATTRNAVEQPYLQFPLRVRSGSIRLIKEITLLLDPPRVAQQRTASTSRATPQSLPPRAQPRAETPATPLTYRVKPGDTLWPIADRLRPREASIYQMMIALQQANPEAFENGNINLIRSGSLLNVPNAQQVLQIGRREASNEFWRQQRAAKKPAPAPAARPAATPSQALPEPVPPSGDPSPEVEVSPLRPPAAAETNTPSASAQPLLEVLPPPEQATAEPQETTTETVRREILLNEEESRSRELEQANIRRQIVNLQAQMDQMDALLKLKDQQIAALQAIIETREMADRLEAADRTLGAPPAAAAPQGTEPGTGGVTQPQPASPVVVKTEPPATAAADRVRESDDTGWWSWLWAVLAGLVILLLALFLKRRSAGQEPGAELPLGAYPEVSGRSKAPAREIAAGAAAAGAAVAATEAAPEAPLTPPMPEPTPPAPDAPAPHPEPAELEEPEAAPPSLAELEDLDLDLGLGMPEEEELPELEEMLIPNAQEEDEAPGEDDKVAAFFDDLDTNGFDSNELDTDELGTSELGTSELGTSELGTSELGTSELGTSELDELENPAEAGEDDQSLEILLEMARAYVELGDREEAEAILRQAMAGADSDDKRARIQNALDEI